MIKDEISNSLGLEPIENFNESEGELVVPKNTEVSDLKPTMTGEKDYDYARTNFYNIIETGTEALEQMLDVAKASEHPRAYEVVSTIMKTLVDANKDLVSMSSKKQESEEQKNPSEKSVSNNNLFVGSTAELQQLLKDMRKWSVVFRQRGYNGNVNLKRKGTSYEFTQEMVTSFLSVQKILYTSLRNTFKSYTLIMDLIPIKMYDYQKEIAEALLTIEE